MYIWRDSSDERVRTAHKENDGKIFSWTNPPATGHPTQDYQCRCDAEPVMLFNLTEKQKNKLWGKHASDIPEIVQTEMVI